MRSVCNVTILGHLAADVELRQTKNGKSLATFPIAINRFGQDENGDRKEIADFHRVVAWQKLGEICSKYLKKGSAVYIQGRLVNNSFDDKDGNRHFRTEIVADEMNIISSKRSETGEQNVAIEAVAA